MRPSVKENYPTERARPLLADEKENGHQESGDAPLGEEASHLLPLGAKLAQVISELNRSTEHGSSRRLPRRPDHSGKME